MAAPVGLVSLIIAGLRAASREGKRVARLARHRLENPKPSKGDLQKLDDAADAGCKSRAARQQTAREREILEDAMNRRMEDEAFHAARLLRNAKVKTKADFDAASMVPKNKLN